jgi:hypothetical protein
MHQWSLHSGACLVLFPAGAWWRTCQLRLAQWYHVRVIRFVEVLFLFVPCRRGWKSGNLCGCHTVQVWVAVSQLTEEGALSWRWLNIRVCVHVGVWWLDLRCRLRL